MKKQIKSRLLRILCTALSLCMVLALTPTTFATTTEEDGSFSIDFVNGVNDATEATYDTTGNVWAYGTASTGLSVSDGGTSYGLKVSSQAVGDYVTITFKAPATGNYKITYDYYTAAAGGYGDVYVVQYTEDISGIIEGEDGKYISDVCYYSSSDKDGTPITSDGYVSLTQNSEYLVVFAVSQAYNLDGKEKFRMFPTSLTFTYVAPTYSDVEAVYSFSTTGKDSDNGYDSTIVTTPNMITYANSDGRVEFDSIKTSADTEYNWQDYVSYFKLDYVGEYVAFRIRVPKAGTYYATLDYRIRSNSTTTDMYIVKCEGEIEKLLEVSEPIITGIDFWDGTHKSDGNVNGIFNALSAGEYYLIFKRVQGENTGDMGYARPAKLTLSGSKDLETTKGYPVAGINTEKTIFEEGNTATLTYTVNDSATGESIDAEVTKLASDGTSVISISGDTITAEGPGVATVSADINGYPASVTLTVNDSKMTAAFSDVSKTEDYASVGDKTVKILKYSTDGKINEFAEDVTVGYNQETSLNLETIGTPDGYTFLYWAKGATNSKQIIPGETCKIYPTVETTYMIAVYAPTGETANKVEFYNYNGQLLDAEIADNKMPALPYMTGYGTADCWAYYGSDETYEEDDDASAFATGTHIFVAQYARLEADIIVTAVNGTANGGSSATVKFGDTVSCVAAGDGTFKWWTKTGDDGKAEIVSLDEEYTFKAWETCTVTAVYGDKAPTYVGETMRIIIDELTVDGTAIKAVMAEFVGLDRAVEKGIMLGTKKIAMSGKDSQFTVINDEGVTDIKGYAILKDGTLITDN